MKLPENHPKRFDLSNEVHARPPEPVIAPVRISCIALTTNWPYKEEDREVVAELTKRYGATPPGPGAKHFSVDLKDFRLIWERHTEFTRYTFIASGGDESPFSPAAIEAAPEAWIEALPGQLIGAAHAALLKDRYDKADAGSIAADYFSNNALIGSKITGGAATALTDFKIHKDGFIRFLIFNSSMSPWHAGRIVQRLLEIETYRVMSLLALPVAQGLTAQLAGWEEEISTVTARMTQSDHAEEPMLLDRLTRLQAAVEQAQAESQFRFSAGEAYYALVRSRIEELREERIAGMQTFNEFVDRRLAPAMNTCASSAKRLHAISERVDRAAQLLSTRVDMSLEQQNQRVLASMDRRVELQLRLQQTVEGLSVAAITYYIVGVISYIATGVEHAGVAIDSKFITGLSAPVILVIVGVAVWRARRKLEAREREGAAQRR